ncbi:putative N-acetylglucosaminyl-phosphatidylinositol de-N-acetylase [Nosema granulosis]|uniref:N-acetylglucosaminylphosphatidylinositol deacetylase n=1 Tax=Nosema granulosis TaxID=83296 RepID=A0A9P6GZ52_9MICR|nr:putative N-acetylglucosaminyl-phosphatidylinositol de-N-acetylase [Nosema granulosis]
MFVFRNIQRLFHEPPNTTGNYVLLIAHPDDESMFFAPTLLNLRGRIKIICLSHGDYDGLGTVRKQEMTKLCSKYGFELILLNFQDNANWDTQDIVDVLYVTYLTSPFKTLITFDSQGVSGHRNHISCYHAAILFSKSIYCKTMFLKSTNLISKYFINFNIFKKHYIVSLSDYFEPVFMMFEHLSQLTWFRWMYISYSNYLSYNSYVE